MSKTYKIVTLVDMLDIPAASIDNFLIDLRVWYDVNHGMKELIESGSRLVGIEAGVENLGIMKWVDDGKHNITVVINPTEEQL